MLGLDLLPVLDPSPVLEPFRVLDLFPDLDPLPVLDLLPGQDLFLDPSVGLVAQVDQSAEQLMCLWPDTGGSKVHELGSHLENVRTLSVGMRERRTNVTTPPMETAIICEVAGDITAAMQAIGMGTIMNANITSVKSAKRIVAMTTIEWVTMKNASITTTSTARRIVAMTNSVRETMTSVSTMTVSTAGPSARRTSWTGGSTVSARRWSALRRR